MFNPILNADGSVSKFRTLCLLVIALCMLAYGYLNYTPTEETEITQTSLSMPAESEAAEVPSLVLPAQDPFVQAKVAALEEFFESINFYTTCGALNKGYEGCKFNFSETVTALYKVDAEASDDGFILSLKLINPKQDRTCNSMTYSSSGDLLSFDEDGNHTEQQCFLEVEQAHAGVVSAPVNEDTLKAN